MRDFNQNKKNKIKIITLNLSKNHQINASSQLHTLTLSNTNRKDHKFWDTQPVPKLKQKIEEEGPLDPIKTKEEIRATPLPLPKGFEFCSVDIQNDKERAEVYKLLTQNYVEDDDNMFRFDYSEKFLLWALTPPGYHKDWHVGVRQVSNKRLRGFITGIPADMRVRGRSIHMAEINFLCVHKKLRDKRLAPVLIKEVTRRINRRDIWQAAYVSFLLSFVNTHTLTQQQ